MKEIILTKDRDGEYLAGELWMCQSWVKKLLGRKLIGPKRILLKVSDTPFEGGTRAVVKSMWELTVDGWDKITIDDSLFYWYFDVDLDELRSGRDFYGEIVYFSLTKA